MTFTSRASSLISASSLTRRRFLARLLASTGAAAALSSVSGVALAQSDGRSIVATTGMVADIIRVLLGEAAAEGGAFQVTGLIGTGVDPHGYRETRADIASLLEADAVFWNGLYLEAQLEELLETLSAQKPVIAVAAATPPELLRAHDEYEGRFDPHIWMNPMLWSYAVEATAATLSAVAPEHAQAITENKAAFQAELTALDAYSREILDTVPQESRVLITAHDAFGYFGDAYGFEVLGVQGVSTESEAGLARIRQIVNLIVERGVQAVFIESSVSARNVEALIEGARAEGADVSLGAELFSDAMGPEGTYEGTYLGMIDHNVTSIARALGGDAPEAGRLGALSAALRDG